MRELPKGIRSLYPPISYDDGRKSICRVPADFVQRALSDQDHADLSAEFGIEERLVRTVVQVESAGSGFLLDEPAPTRPKILFEAHIFYQRTPQPVSGTRPDLSSPKWDKRLYKGGSGEWERLLDAMAFDEYNAIQSASWGLGQVMGFNYEAAGCTSAYQLVREAFAGEYWQARHMMNFIASRDLLSPLVGHDWAGFAFGYNGAGYSANQYDAKLAAAYNGLRMR